MEERIGDELPHLSMNDRKRLKNEQGDKAATAKRLDDYQLQMALDYLHSWSVFSQQIGRR